MKNIETSLAVLFGNEELRVFLKNILKELDENPYELKKLLKHGYEKYHAEIIEELSNDFNPLIKDKKDENGFTRVERCIDGVIFEVGDVVRESVSKKKYPIGRMYEDDRGLHIRLNVDGDNTITWRKLGQLEKI